MPSGSAGARWLATTRLRAGDVTLAVDDVEADDAVAVDHRAHVGDVGRAEADADDVEHGTAHLALDRPESHCSVVVHPSAPAGRSSKSHVATHPPVEAKARQYGLQASGGVANRRSARRRRRIAAPSPAAPSAVRARRAVERTVQEEALAILALELDQLVKLLDGLDALSDRGQAEDPRQMDDRSVRADTSPPAARSSTNDLSILRMSIGNRCR